jgi:hypothetical protein
MVLWQRGALLLVVNWDIAVAYLFLVSSEKGENLDLAESRKREARGK